MKVLSIFCWIIIFSASFIPGLRAQELTDTARLYRELAVLQTGYKDKPVSYDMRYSYASELHPDIVLDSMKGSVSIYNNVYKYQLDNMETVATGTYNIVLFKEEKVMYIVKPATASSLAPLDHVRKMMNDAGVHGYTIKEDGREKTVHINFVQGASCREMEVVVDKKTQRLQTIQYVIKTSLLMQESPDMEAKTIAEYGPFAIVTQSFTHYQPLTTVPDWLDTAHFFYKDGTELKTAPAYNEFKIFKGSPNL